MSVFSLYFTLYFSPCMLMTLPKYFNPIPYQIKIVFKLGHSFNRFMVWLMSENDEKYQDDVIKCLVYRHRKERKPENTHV